MKSKRWIFLVVFVLGIVAIVITVWASQTTPAAEAWDVSGFIEAEEIAVAPEIAGRIVRLPFEEGDEVKAGDELLHLEDDIWQAQVDAARGQLAEAQAMLAKAQAGARPEAIEKAGAQLRLAEAGRDAARQTWRDAQAVRDNPQMLDVQLAAARAKVTTTQKQLEAALIQRDLAEKAWKDYGEISDKLANVPPKYRPHLPIDYYTIPYQWQQAIAAVQVAVADNTAARTVLDDLLEQRSNPQTAQAQVDAALAKYQAAEAAVTQAQAALDGVKAGSTQEQIAAARAQVEVAQAALAAAEVQLNKATVRAPINGLIVETGLQVGEMAAPNIAALTLADLDQVTLTIYVPGSDLGRVALGQIVSVRVDAFADRVFNGPIVWISDQAEYTPRNIRTSQERTKQVYAVKIKLGNPDHVLKPGLPAEAQVSQ